MGAMLYVRPDECFSHTGAASLGGGTVDSDYLIAWVCDTRVGRPVRMTGTGLITTITNSSMEVGIVAVANHNLTVNCAISGGVSGTITPATLPPNRIPLNPFVQVTPTSITTFTATISSNGATLIVGEILAGKARTLQNYASGTGAPRYLDIQFVDDDFALPNNAEFQSFPPYDRGMERRRLTGTQLYSTSQLASLRAWRQAEKATSLPSLIVPDAAVNDAWVVQFRGLSYKPHASDVWEVSLDFVEHPRVRW